MPNHNPRTPKRSWRGERAASPRPGTGQPAWKADLAAGPGPRVSRGVKIALVLALFLLVAGGVVAVYLWLRPPDPFRLVLVGAGYEQNLAVESNVLGRRGLDGLDQWAKDYNEKLSGRDQAKNVDVKRQTIGESNDPVADALANCTSKAVVVYLSGDGGADDQGAYLLRENAGPRDLAAGYRIDKVLDALKNKLDSKTQKLLILDGSHNGADWSMGQLHNDFIRSVKKLEPRIKEIDHLVVLCSCDEGQQSWDSVEFGQSAFAHYVIEGLKGAADHKADSDDPEQCAAGDGDGRVTALELTRYVQCQVERWARRNRGAVQKPQLLGDEGVAHDMELAGADTNYQPPDPSALSGWSPPDELLKAWQGHEALANGSPPPAAYTPQQWREYEAALLRYEQLLRTGGDDAEALRQKVNKLHDQIAQARRPDRDSMIGSVAAPAAFGWSLPADTADALKAGFDKHWRNKDKPDEFKSLLDEAQAKAPNRATRRLVRLRLIDLLLDKATAKTATHDDYLRVCDVLMKLADPPDPAPAEANFAVTARLTEAQLPAHQVASWDRLRQSLAVRRLAEAAALGLGAGPPDLPAYSEQTVLWDQAAVGRADVNRRLGEDLMFASMPEDERAATAFKAAEQGGEFTYKTVQDRALAVRTAIRARDQALAELPSYTQWLGRRELSDDDLKQLEGLWAKVHDLCGQLEKPDYAGAVALTAASDAVNTGVQRLRERFRTACGDEKTQWRTLQDDLQTLDDLLSVPLIEPDLRMNLLRAAAQISLDLNKGTAKAGAAGDDKPDSADHAKALAYQQARLAVFVLGEDTEEGKDAIHLLPPREQQLWQGELDTVGDKIAHGFQKLGRNAAEAADKARKAPPADAAAPLRLAALNTRFLDAGEAEAWLASVDPVDENRRVQLHDLLVWQAERSRLDYWASPDPAAPYYRTAGLVYLGDAADEVAGEVGLKDEEKEARLVSVKSIEARLREPDAFAFRWLDGRDWKVDPEKLHVTDVYTIQLQYGIAGPKDTPAGRPVVWAAPGAKLTAPQGVGDPRSLERVTDQPADASVTYGVSPLRPPEGPPPDDVQKIPPPKEDTDFAVNGLFRGRSLAMDTPVRLHNRPDLVSYQPKEDKTALIAVQADPADLKAFAARNSDLVVVLDYSDSMNLPADPIKSPKGPRRIDKALDALEQCLDKLPDGVNLTVLTFSAKGEKSIAEERKRGVWSQSQSRDLMESLRALHPAYNTPLVRSAALAASKFDASFQGTKTILILTDGGDNEFYPRSDGQDTGRDIRIDPRTGKELTMKDFLERTFKGSDVHIHVVGFREEELENDPKGNADEIRGLKEFKPAILNVGGTFQDVEDASKLAEELQQYFLQIRFWVEYDNGDPVDAAAREGLQVSGTNKNIRPTIPVPAPADYHVLVEAFRHESRTGHDLPDQHVHVEPGEVLVLDLKQSSKPDRPFDLRRDVFAQSNVLHLSRPVMDPMPAGGDWLLTILGNTAVKNKLTRYARDITLSMERTDDHVSAQGTVRQPRPTLAWFNVLPEAGQEPVSGLRFYPRPNYPAPVWRLSLADWQPPAAAPIVDAWWCEDELPDSAVTTLRQGPGREYVLPADLNGRPIDVHPTVNDPPGQVVVESVGLERRYVEERLGLWTPDLDCLVVRLRYPPGRPYFVQLPDELMKNEAGQRVGYEHRFYTEANKYTGVFYGVGPAQLQKLAWLKLVSVEGAKTKAMHPAPVAIRAEGQPPDPIK